MKAIVGASRGLLRDYEPSDGPFSSSSADCAGPALGSQGLFLLTLSCITSIGCQLHQSDKKCLRGRDILSSWDSISCFKPLYLDIFPTLRLYLTFKEFFARRWGRVWIKFVAGGSILKWKAVVQLCNSVYLLCARLRCSVDSLKLFSHSSLHLFIFVRGQVMPPVTAPHDTGR